MSDQSVFEDFWNLIRNTFNEIEIVFYGVPEKRVNYLGDVTGSEQIMSIIINRKLLSYLIIKTDEKLAQMFRYVCITGIILQVWLRVLQQNLNILDINRVELVACRVTNIRYPNISCESCGKLVSTDRRTWVHRRNYLNTLIQINKLKIFVVEAFVCDYLL